MSAFKRILIGSAGSWMGIGITFAQRLLIVPLVLNAWSADQYGFYLVLAAAIGLFGLPGRSFELIIGRELLRTGGERPEALRDLHGGGIVVGFTLEAIVAAIAYSVFRFSALLSPEASRLIAGHEFGLCCAIFVNRSINVFAGTTYSQVLSCYGYFPKLIWLGLVSRALAVVIPGAGALMGLGPVGVTLLDLLSPTPFMLPAWMILRRWGKKCGVWGWSPTVAPAFRILLLSLQNLMADIVIMMRGEGLRLILASTVGNVALAAFATIRTGANLAQQGLSTISIPLMPELMRYLRARDQNRMHSAFAVIWLPQICLMCPAIVALQWGVAPLFELWTRGKVKFDPLLFALLSGGVLLNAVLQPSIAIVTGNNLLRTHLTIACAISAMVVVGVLVTAPVWGITGVAGILLLSEVIGVWAYAWSASRWLRNNGLSWPVYSFYHVLLSTAATTFAIVAHAVADRFTLTIAILLKYGGTAFAMGMLGYVALQVVRDLPTQARGRLTQFAPFAARWI